MIRPQPCSCIRGRQARMSRNGAERLTSSARFQSESPSSATGAIFLTTALLIRMSIPPMAPPASAASLSAAPSTARSMTLAPTVLPVSAESVFAASVTSGKMSARKTLSPAAVKARAKPRPSPVAEPVTSTRRGDACALKVKVPASTKRSGPASCGIQEICRFRGDRNVLHSGKHRVRRARALPLCRTPSGFTIVSTLSASVRPSSMTVFLSYNLLTGQARRV